MTKIKTAVLELIMLRKRKKRWDLHSDIINGFNDERKEEGWGRREKEGRGGGRG